MNNHDIHAIVHNYIIFKCLKLGWIDFKKPTI